MRIDYTLLMSKSGYCFSPSRGVVSVKNNNIINDNIGFSISSSLSLSFSSPSMRVSDSALVAKPWKCSLSCLRNGVQSQVRRQAPNPSRLHAALNTDVTRLWRHSLNYPAQAMPIGHTTSLVACRTRIVFLPSGESPFETKNLIYITRRVWRRYAQECCVVCERTRTSAAPKTLQYSL
jgi:hypothetical protein